MSFTAQDVVPISEARARLTELADDVVSGAGKLLTKNGAAYVALVDAKKLDYYHALEEEHASLAACRTWIVESENRPQRAQFLPDLQPNSPAIGQKYGEKWAAAVDLQPATSKSDRLLVLLTEAEAGLREVLAGHRVSNADLMKALS